MSHQYFPLYKRESRRKMEKKNTHLREIRSTLLRRGSNDLKPRSSDQYSIKQAFSFSNVQVFF